MQEGFSDSQLCADVVFWFSVYTPELSDDPYQPGAKGLLAAALSAASGLAV